MSDAKTLLRNSSAASATRRKQPPCSPEDGVFGLPFFVSLGLPTRLEGPVGVKGVLTTVLDYYPDFEFNDEDITVLIDTPKQVFAEYVTHATAAATGRRPHHLFMGHLVAPRTARSRCCARP